MMHAAPAPTYFDEVIDFLSSAPTAEELIAYRPSQALDQRLHELLDLNANDVLNAEERLELEEFSKMDHFLTLLQLKARLKRGIDDR
jgi:hypothetical protein